MSESLIGRPMEILLVEDSLTDAKLTLGALKSGDIKHRTTLLRDGAEAVAFLRREGMYARAPQPDLILLDLLLPRLSGLEVLEQIHGDEQLGNIPVVVLSGSEDSTDRQSCELMGVDSYINKPVNWEKFVNVLRRLKRYWHEDLVIPALD
jgi:chemotaxis family two-component system response regulator Rcp1